MIRRLLPLIALLLLCAPAHAQETRNLTFAGHDRPYIVHTPPGYNTDLSHPVIIALHGGGGNPEQFMDSSGLNDAGDRAGMLVVYPSGHPGDKRESLRTWNAGKCCAGAAAAASDDVGYIRAVLDDLPGYYNIDKSRIYVTGHSNGAMMSYRLSCELSDLIAAIAPVAGQSVIANCKPARAIPILHIHGTADNCATYNGGAQCGGCFADFAATMSGRDNPVADKMTWPCDPVPQSLAARAALYGCAVAPEITANTGPVNCQYWRGCRNGATVALCSLLDAGHSWPGGKEPRRCEKRPEGKLCQNWRSRSGTPSPVNAANMIADFFLSVK